MSSVGQHASDFGHSGLVPEREHDRQPSQTDTTRRGLKFMAHSHFTAEFLVCLLGSI